MSGTAGTGGSTSLGLLGPVEASSDGVTFFLEVVDTSPRNSGDNMGLIVAGSARGGTFGHFVSGF